MFPKIKIIQTSDGPKLHDGKNLKGSLPTKPKVPKSGLKSKIKKKDLDNNTNNVGNRYDALTLKQEWFHSTPEELMEGTVLIPGINLGINNFVGDDKANNKKVWIEPQAYGALGWGSQATRRQGKEVAHIYQVMPSTAPVKKSERGWITDSAVILKLVATVPAVAYYNDEDTKTAIANNNLLNIKDSNKYAEIESKLFREHLEGALSNYICLGEIPDHNSLGTQGYSQYQAIMQEIRIKGVINTVPLYRGASRNPMEDLADPEHVDFLSYTPDRKVAEHFVRFNSGAKLYTAPIGSVKGIQVNHYDYPLPDQAEEYGFEYYDHENEWLVITK